MITDGILFRHFGSAKGGRLFLNLGAVIVEKMTPGAVHGPDYMRGRDSNRGREACDELEAAEDFLVAFAFAFAFESLSTITILLVAEFKLVVYGE